MSSGTNFRVEFSVQRCQPGGDWEEIGFGSSGTCGSIDDAAHMLNSAVQNRDWETSGEMPEPREVDVNDR